MDFLKNAFFLALSALLLTTIVWSQPALAVGNIKVINNSKYPAKTTILYYTALCRDDRPTIAPRSQWSGKSGLCKIKDQVTVLTDEHGVGHTCVGGRGPTPTAIFYIYKRTSVPGAWCEVSTTSISNNMESHLVPILPSTH